MSHEITIREDGFAEAAFSMQPAWHGLGTVFDHTMASGEALKGAGLDWQVEQWPVAVGKPKVIVPFDRSSLSEEPDWLPQDDHRANVRSDTQAILGYCSDHYKVVQNDEAFAFLDALVENHEMKYESAFSLRGGKKVCLLARMPGVDKIVDGDHVLRYILLSLSHDGKEAITFGPTAVRVVCANTYSMAQAEGNQKELSIRHSGNIQEKLSRARNILGIASHQFSQYAEIGQKLAQHRLSVEDWKDYLNLMCPELDPRDPDYTERRAEKLLETRLAITECYRNERQATAPMTAWAAYNAVSEHIDHLPRRGASPGRKAEARFSVCMYGTGRDMKERAFQAAQNFAGLAG